MEKENKEKRSNGSKQQSSSSKNMIAVLSYFGILVIIPLLVAKEDEFVKYHVKQGLVLLIAGFVLMFVSIIPLLGWIIGLLGWIFLIVLAVMGIVNVVGGKKKELPIIGQYADKFKI